MKTVELPLVSIVVTTKNEEKNIESCLRSIMEQKYPKIEVIVVDNCSSDKTVELSKKYTTKVFDKGPERSAQRNFGIMEVSRSDYAMFVDADMILGPGLIEACVKSMQNNPWKALYIPEIILGKNFGSQVRRFERSFYDGTVIDAARFFKRSTFIQCKGFDESITGFEDWDLDKRIKQLGQIKLLSPCCSIDLYNSWELKGIVCDNGVNEPLVNVIFHNESEFNLKQYLKKKKYYIGFFNNYFKKWGRNDPVIKKQFGFVYRNLGVFLERGKWRRVIVHPVLVIGVLGLRFLVGIVFLFGRFKLFCQENFKSLARK